MVYFSWQEFDCFFRYKLLFHLSCDTLVLTDNDFKSTNAYQFLKEVGKEVYNESNLSNIDIENAPNLSHCKETVSSLIGSFMQEGGKKNDKVGKAQEIVD